MKFMHLDAVFASDDERINIAADKVWDALDEVHGAEDPCYCISGSYTVELDTDDESFGRRYDELILRKDFMMLNELKTHMADIPGAVESLDAYWSSITGLTPPPDDAIV